MTLCDLLKLVVIGGATLPAVALAQPANDVCGANVASFTVPGTGGVLSGSMAGATHDAGSGACAGDSDGRDVYAYFTPATSGQWVISLCDSLPAGGLYLDSVLSVHTSCPATSANLAGAGACNDDFCGPSGNVTLSQVTLNLNAGTTYTIRIANFTNADVLNDPPKPFTIRIFQNQQGACCMSARGTCVLTSADQCRSENVFKGAGTTCTPGLCGTIGSCSNGLNGACYTSFQRGCPFGPPLTGDEPAFWEQGFACGVGAPANDECSGAITVVEGRTTGLSSVGATTSIMVKPPVFCNQGGANAAGFMRGASLDVWYAFTPAVPGTYRIAVLPDAAAQFGGTLAVYASCPASGLTAPVACDDGSSLGRGCPGFGSANGLVIAQLNGGVTYSIRVANSGFTSKFALDIAKVLSGACCTDATNQCRLVEACGCRATAGETYLGDGTVCSPGRCLTNVVAPRGYSLASQSGFAAPSVSIPNGTLDLAIYVESGNNPASSGVQVQVDASVIGGPSTLVLRDDGVSPDGIAGDAIFTGRVVIPGNGSQATNPERWALPFVVTDAQGRSSTGAAPVITYRHQGACCRGSACTIEYGDTCAATGGRWSGPDTTCSGAFYRQSSGSIPFNDISASGVPLSGILSGNSCAQQVQLPFSFNYFGTSYSRLWVNVNGLIEFSSVSSCASGSDILKIVPNADSTLADNNRIAPYWDVVYQPGTNQALFGGKLHSRTQGTAPNRTFTVSWKDWVTDSFGASFPSVTQNFQVVLHEGTGVIDLVYGNLVPQYKRPFLTTGLDNSSADGMAAVGIENIDGTLGLRVATYSLGTGNTSRSFTPVSIVTACCPADFNGAGGVTVQDIFDFLAAWFAGNPSADFNGVSGVTVQDIFDFLAAWFMGC